VSPAPTRLARWQGDPARGLLDCDLAPDSRTLHGYGDVKRRDAYWIQAFGAYAAAATGSLASRAEPFLTSPAPEGEPALASFMGVGGSRVMPSAA
jgi:hypothetical protein